MSPHHLTNFEKQSYHQAQQRFNGFYSKTNLIKIKVKTYVINIDQCKLVGAH